MRKLLSFVLLSLFWLTAAFAQTGNVGTYGIIQGSGSFIAISVDGSGNFTIKNSIVPNASTAVPIRTTIPGSGTGLVFTADSSNNFTYAVSVASNPFGNAPVIGYAAGAISRIDINTDTGVVSAGSFSTTLTALTNNNVQLSVPSGFNGTLPVNFFRTSLGVYTSDFNPTALIPPVTTPYYFSTAGNGGNSGLTPAAPLNTFGAIFAKANVDQLRMLSTCTGLPPGGTCAANGGNILWGNRGWAGALPTRSLSIVPDDGISRFVSVAAATNGVGPTWTLTGGTTNVYQTTYSGTPTYGPTDLKFLDSNGDFLKPLLVASCTAADSVPNSFFTDGVSTLCVNASNGAGGSRNLIGDTWMTGVTTGLNGGFTTASALTLWVQNVDFVVGQPFNAVQASAPAGAAPIIVMVSCTFQGSTINIDGFETNGKYNVYLVNSRAVNNYGDGFGYHALNGVSGQVLETGLSTGFNGFLNSSNQSSTAHDSMIIYTLNPNYRGAANQTIRDITSAQRWSMGGFLGAPIQSDSSGNTIGIDAQMWLDGTTVTAATSTTLNLAGTAVLRYRNNSTLSTATKTGTGTLLPY